MHENRRFSPKLGKELKHYETPAKSDVTPLSDVSEAKCMVFACLYPSASTDFSKLHDTITKLQLNDASVQCNEIKSEALGQGFRCGFLGILHMEVFRQRLEDESGIQVLIAAPTITYKAIFREQASKTVVNSNVNANKVTTDEDGKKIVHIESPEDYPENPGLVEQFGYSFVDTFFFVYCAFAFSV